MKSDPNQSAVIHKVKKTFTEKHIPPETENAESEKTSLKEETLREEQTFGASLKDARSVQAEV